jgi:hypothetical protein
MMLGGMHLLTMLAVSPEGFAEAQPTRMKYRLLWGYIYCMKPGMADRIFGPA